MADNRKLAQGLMMMTPSARADLAQREEDVQRGKTVELLRRAGKEMYDNPIVNTAIGFTPVLGDVQAAGETMAALNRGAPWQETAGYAAGMLPFVPMIGKTVWHGSPHTFDKFDLSKIGTGEGAQAYGHGLYLADAPEVASQYKANRSYVGKALSGNPEAVEFNAQRIAQDAADIHGNDALSHLEGVLQANSQSKNKYQIAENQKVADAIELLKHGQVSGSGSLYKVDLPDEQIAKMLDWDKPLSEQPETVRNALGEFASSIAKQSNEQRMLLNQQNPERLTHPVIGKLAQKESFAEDVAGNKLHEYLARELGGSEKVSEYLRQQGIPGIQYLDQASRGAGEGTRNYVVFSDEIPQILERNGQPVAQALRNYEAPQAQALREAEEYGQKMLGLPPGNTPMDRAIAGGFEPMYHGTADEIVNLNPEKYGSSTGAQSAKQGFWGVKTVPTAEGYANYAAKQAPVQKLLNEADVAGNKGDWDKYDDLLRQAEELETDVYNQPLRGQNVMPLMVNTKNAKIVDMGGAEYTDVEGGINQYLKQGKREGKDVVVLENLSDDPGRSNMQTTHFGVLNPAAVRSQFAAFDPRYFGKPGLMLGAGGLGVYGALQGEDEYQ